MKLTITVDHMFIIRWWVDASDRTHHDCRGHSGIMMSLGGGGTGQQIYQATNQYQEFD
jgi:hypothetical protein